MHSIMDVATVARSCFKNNAHEMMAHMLMWMHRCKANTWGVTAGVLRQPPQFYSAIVSVNTYNAHLG
jgi:hypothetical protein